jgi:hypothetical protein
MRLRRPPLRNAASLLPLTAAAVLTTILVGTSAPAQVFRAQGSSGVAAPRGGSNMFGIRVGSVTGLRPAGEVTVPVRYSNPFPHSLVVRSQDIQVSSPARACPATTVDLTRARSALAKPLVLPARQSKTVIVVLSMQDTAPEGCQGVRFTTTVRAQGRKS